ncbi:hypothetical protein C8Q74DRAFT_1364606 [Fomes fomentarius]|nr:hypothetical protein C8Q74DRAFT_1364606 [Fomes fomentarius]
MVGQPPLSVNTFNTPNNPSFMEDAMASLRFDNNVDGPALYPPSQPPDSTRSTTSARIQQVTRHQNNAAVNLDPAPGDPDTVFIRAPFNEFPGSSERKTGLSYNDMAANPDWFLDVRDFTGPNAVGYPPQLEPPRGWCPSKKKDAKDTWKEGEEPRLRCTLCRRQYAGVNAKSMWRRHVYEKHKIAMANRRENNDRPGGRSRGSNKENKVASSSKSSERDQGARPKAIRRVVSLEVEVSGSGSGSSSSQVEPLSATSTNDHAGEADRADSAGEEDQSYVEGPSYSSTPPQTPGLTDTLQPAFDIVVPPESPYNPLMTPSFRHSPARIQSKRVWRFSSPKVGHKTGDYTLAMLAREVREEGSPVVRGLDVSPIVLIPANERQRRSIFSPLRKSPLAVSPRRLFLETVEGDSIQSRLDRPGWDALSTPGNALTGGFLGSPGHGPVSEIEDYIRDWIEGGGANPESGELAAPLSSSTPLRLGHATDGAKADYFALAAGQNVPPSPTPWAQCTPRTKMFINGIVSPPKEPESSPIPSLSAGPSTGSRGRGASPSPPHNMPSNSFALLLPPFDNEGSFSPTAPSRSLLALDTPDTSMEVDEPLPPPDYRDIPDWQDIFGAPTSVRAPAVGETNGIASVSTSLSGTFGHFSSLSASGSSLGRKTTSSSPSIDLGRAYASLSTNSQKSSIGLMEAVLEKKSRRRKHSYSESRDGDVGVTAMGSPFKMSRKTSRSEFLYSLDGDCEMQDTQPKKRRKTTSGRD